MKWLAFLLAAVLLTGCGGKNPELDRAMALRAKLLTADCTFEAEITADYGDELSVFSVYCEANQQGDLGFRVTAPETIADITGRIQREEGNLTFSDTVLAFPLLAEEQLSPVSSSWMFLKCLRGGYLTSAGMDGELLRLTIDDRYEEKAITLDIWLDSTDTPVRAEFCWEGRRILTMNITNFQIL